MIILSLPLSAVEGLDFVLLPVYAIALYGLPSDPSTKAVLPEEVLYFNMRPVLLISYYCIGATFQLCEFLLEADLLLLPRDVVPIVVISSVYVSIFFLSATM